MPDYSARPHPAPNDATRQNLRREIVAQAHEIGARPEGDTDWALEDPIGAVS
jgi:hypothetical protein